MPYIKPTSDIFIKYLLGTEDHKDLLLFIELPKFKNYNINMDKKLEKWLYYLKQEGIEKEDKIMEILLKEDAAFKKAHEKYAAFTRDDEMVEAYESHMKWVRDYNSRVFFARKEGRKEGELIGKIQLLQQILKKPVSDETELLQQDINQLETMFQNLQKELTIQ